jgi:hypothetical protein
MDESSTRDHNLDQFKDILSSALIEKIQKPQKSRGAKHRKRNKQGNDETAADSNRDESSEANAEELSEFSDYIATIAFESLPLELQTITHRIWANSPHLQEEYALPLTSNDISDKITPTLPESTVRKWLSSTRRWTSRIAQRMADPRLHISEY